MVKEFDKLRKHISTKEGKIAAKAFRKMLARSEKYANKLDSYFTDTLDGMETEQSKELNGL